MTTKLAGRAAPVWVLLGVAAIIVTAAPAGRSLTQQEKARGVGELARTRNAILKATQGLSDSQWNYRPSPGNWSIGEIVEHIILTEESLLGNIIQNVMQAPAGPPDREVERIDELVLSAIADRSRKAKAPEPLTPRGKWPPEQALSRFEATRRKTTEFLSSSQGLRDHVTDSPLGQSLDAYQWVLFISAHSDRHLRQIVEVKQSARFPQQ